MPMPSDERRYEFDDAQNATFARLAAAMMFVAVAMTLLSIIVGTAAIVVARSAPSAGAIVAPLSVAAAVIAAQQYAAARRFQRIVASRGNDISNLMVALDDMAKAYGVQRWLWISVLVAVLAALATTIVSR